MATWRFPFLLSISLLLFADRALAQTSALDLIPQESAVSIAIRDLDDLIKKGDGFIKDADIRYPIRPSELFDEGAKQLGIRKGLDRKAPAALLLMTPEREDDINGFGILKLLVPVLPYTSAKDMASNFGIPSTKFVLKGIVKTDRGPGAGIENYAMRRQKHIYLAESDKLLRRIQKSKPVADGWTADQRKLFDDSDVLLHFGRFAWKMGAEGDAPSRFLENALGSDDVHDKEFIEQALAALRDAHDGVTGFRMHDGLEMHYLMTGPKDGAAAKFLKSLKAKQPTSTLKGLPEGNVLLAQASAAGNPRHALVTKALFSFMLNEVLVNRRGIHHVDRFTYMGVFHEVWRRLEGNRLAVYQNADEKKLGLFTAIAILDTEDAKEFLRDMKVLTKMAIADSLDLTKKEVKEEIDIERLVRDLRSSVYAVRQSATTQLALVGEPALPPLNKALDSPDFDLESKRRARELRDRISAVAAQRRRELLDEKNRPLFAKAKMTFIANVEKRQDVSVHVINLKLAGLDKTLTHQFTQIVGPDWDKIRIAVIGNQIVVMVGSDLALFETTIKNIQKGEAGLANTKRLAAFQERAAKDRLFEFHVSVEGAMRLIDAKAKLDSPLQLTSVSLALGETSLQVDARVPMPEVRAIARKAQEQMKVEPDPPK